MTSYVVQADVAPFGHYKITVHDTESTGNNGDHRCTIELEFGGQHSNGPDWPSSDSDAVVFSFSGPNMEWATLPDLLIALGQELQRIRVEVLK